MVARLATGRSKRELPTGRNVHRQRTAPPGPISKSRTSAVLQSKNSAGSKSKLGLEKSCGELSEIVSVGVGIILNCGSWYRGAA